MNERGIFTIIGLCLLIVAAIFMKGIQEFEENYSRGVTNFWAEHELQNIADSVLIEGIEKNWENFTKTVTSERLGTVTAQFSSKQITFNRYIRDYPALRDPTNTIVKDSNGKDWQGKGKLIISVASCDSGFMAGKIHRRALAYILNDDETVHFMSSF